jgi:ribosomal protein S7
MDYTFAVVSCMSGFGLSDVVAGALRNCSPREDTTKFFRGGFILRSSVDVGPVRRIGQALWNLSSGAREGSFRGVRSLGECMADEFLLASFGSSSSSGVCKRVLVEALARETR